MARDLYETLGVPRGSDERAVKRAFREAARKWHPDVNSSPEARRPRGDAIGSQSDAPRPLRLGRHLPAATRV